MSRPRCSLTWHTNVTEGDSAVDDAKLVTYLVATWSCDKTAGKSMTRFKLRNPFTYVRSLFVLFYVETFIKTQNMTPCSPGNYWYKWRKRRLVFSLTRPSWIYRDEQNTFLGSYLMFIQKVSYFISVMKVIFIECALVRDPSRIIS
jgi:hypothetical protein